VTAVSVRLSEGIYSAIGELAEEFGISKADMTTLLLYASLESVKGWQFSQRTLTLINADTLESYGSLLRRMAKMKPDERAAVEKFLADLFTKLAKVFPGKE
jgi:hypothetical protein